MPHLPLQRSPQYRSLLAGTLLLAALQSPLWAQTAAPPVPAAGNERLAALKKRLLARLDQEIDRLSSAEDCIQAAASLEAVKACRPPRPAAEAAAP